jgi:hypothetical protein
MPDATAAVLHNGCMPAAVLLGTVSDKCNRHTVLLLLLPLHLTHPAKTAKVQQHPELCQHM